jgi:hypothetical protein
MSADNTRENQRVLVLKGGPKGPPVERSMTVGELRRELKRKQS